jgi:hypothetical protein
MSPALTVSEAEMRTALRIFADAVVEVAREGTDKPVLHAAQAAHAITGVEAGG